MNNQPGRAPTALEPETAESIIIEPTIRAFVEQMAMAFAAHPDAGGLSIAVHRRVAEAVRKPWREGGPVMASVSDRRILFGQHDVGIRVMQPKDAERAHGLAPALVYMHGGGWTLFSLDTHDRLMREYADRSGLTVIGVDYSLSPEAKFPVALNEVVAVVRWLGQAGPSLGVDPARVAIGGDSAGANLAMAACLKLRDEGDGARIRGMLLNYGAFQLTRSPETIARFGGPRFMLTGEEMDGFWSNYLASPDDAVNPLASPILADLAGLPPAHLAIAECDILADESRLMAERLTAAGVPNVAITYQGATHSFLEAMSISPLAGRALADGAEWLRAMTTQKDTM